jgi:hypothetical protein
VRTYSFPVALLVASGLAGMLAFATAGEQPNAEPSELQMQRPFGEFFAKVEAKPVSEVQFIAFKKGACQRSGSPGYYCSFTYATNAPAELFSVLPAQGTISGMFFSDHDGRLKFEMVIG